MIRIHLTAKCYLPTILRKTGKFKLYHLATVLSESRRRNAVQEGESAEDDTSSMKSINLPSYEDLQPPSYDVAVHL
ncbi:hypothetical protein TNCV_2418691 [Trichonephila clavipes]|nr:hypothetical protein TNCV_2418691 [Trichonephila clavipes]